MPLQQCPLAHNMTHIHPRQGTDVFQSDLLIINKKMILTQIILE